MLPVLFDLVVPDGFAKPAAVALLVAIVALRAVGYLRRARKDGEVSPARRDDDVEQDREHGTGRP